VEGFFLAGGFLGFDIGSKVALGEGSRMSEMGIQRRDEGGSFLDEAHPGMGVSVDVSRVSFGEPKEAFEVEVVLGGLGIVFPDEESGMETLHRLGHVLSDEVVVLFPGLLKGEKGCFALIDGPGGRIEGAGELAEFVDMDAEVGAGGVTRFQAPVETSTQPLQRAFYGSLFF
jgi:hypothetical protein